MFKKIIALLMVLCLLVSCAAMAESAEPVTDWVTFLLECNEGNSNDGGNVGNTLMLCALSPSTGKVRLASIAWDTFVTCEGYEVPQKLDQPFRYAGPVATMKTVNSNFGYDVDLYLSVNYINLAGLIDSFGGVDVDLTRAERNALNGMIDSKKASLQAKPEAGFLGQLITELLAQEYNVEDYGPATHLNGLQAVAYGWLKYDGVYQCCIRELYVISALFHSVGSKLAGEVCLVTDESGVPEDVGDRRVINLDHLTDEDHAWIRSQVDPIFTYASHNMTEEQIDAISVALVKAYYVADNQGIDIFEQVESQIFPLEATNEYDYIASVAGHVIDFDANSEAITNFLYAE